MKKVVPILGIIGGATAIFWWGLLGWVEFTGVKDKLDKERISNWSSKKYKVKDIKESMNQKFYELEGYDKPLMRSELLLLD